MNTMMEMMELSSILHGFPLLLIVIGFWLLAANTPSVRRREAGSRDGQ